MTGSLLIEYRILCASQQVATASLFANGLENTALMQLLRIDTGAGKALSVYVVYREGSMTFEASARLNAARSRDPLESILRDLVEDADFLGSLLTPMTLAVDGYFARLAC